MKALTPEKAVQFATTIRPVKGPRVDEFFHAMLILVSKGFGIDQAAMELTGQGCTIPAAELAAMYRRKVLETL